MICLGNRPITGSECGHACLRRFHTFIFYTYLKKMLGRRCDREERHFDMLATTRERVELGGICAQNSLRIWGCELERKSDPDTREFYELPVHPPDGALVSRVNKPNVHEAVLTHLTHLLALLWCGGRPWAETLQSTFSATSVA